MTLPNVEQVPNLTVAQLLPHLSDRGRIEVEAAFQRVQIAELEQVLAQRDARIAELEADDAG